MMDTKQQYNKIQQFIKQHYRDFNDSGTVTVHPTDTGFEVGNFTITNIDNGWQVINNKGQVIYELHQRRLAILLAALLCKKKYEHARLTAGIDQKYDIFASDRGLYEYRAASNPDNYVYKHRLNRVVDELDTLNSQIIELEKSACLQ